MNSASTQDTTLAKTRLMNASDVQYFKDILVQQRTDILNKNDLFKTDSAVENIGQGDEGDLASSEVNLSLSLRLQERETQLLIKIDHALGKIEEGSFGLCEQCEEELNVNRLKARPVASLCISCKEEQESKERVFA
jgi:DnaK suppressor protein